VTAAISAISVHLPQRRLTNEDLQREFPDWTVEKIASKTGIDSRHIAGEDEFSSDLAIGAGRALFAEHDVDPATIDFLIVCTQTPDHLLPSTSLLVHAALGLRTDCGAFDFTLGCSGYVYGLGLAKGLIDSGQAERVLLITADTYTKLLNPADRSVRTIFGDAAAATLLVRSDRGVGRIVYGSDGTGAGALAVPGGGLAPGSRFPKALPSERELEDSGYDLYMDGPAVFNFTLRVVPESVERLLGGSGIARDDVDTWILHQANAFMLGHLRRKLGIAEDRFVVDMADTGNTVSSSIPIALSRAMQAGRILPGSRSVLLGFGVGLSWAGAIVEW
jgi:3-oxoacyl-[acyl-carrier-protein] synthase-3